MAFVRMPDDYTKTTKKGLVERSRGRQNEDRGELPFQPIYGFRKGRSGSGGLLCYARMYGLMRALSRLSFNSLLDVGAAEGYTAYVAKELFGAEVVCCDFLELFCSKSKRIFNIQSAPADIHCLPFKDKAFDVVVCTSTLEHVQDPRKAVSELMRVSARAVLLTVPHERKKLTDKNLKNLVPHGHVHSFKLDSLDYLRKEGWSVTSQKLFGLLLNPVPALVPDVVVHHEGQSAHASACVSALRRVRNALLPVIARVVSPRTEAWLVELDSHLCRFSPIYGEILFLIVKDKGAGVRGPLPKVSASRIMNTGVPFG